MSKKPSILSYIKITSHLSFPCSGIRSANTKLKTTEQETACIILKRENLSRKNNVPYLYTSEIGGFGIHRNRQRAL